MDTWRTGPEANTARFLRVENCMRTLMVALALIGTALFTGLTAEETKLMHQRLTLLPRRCGLRRHLRRR